MLTRSIREQSQAQSAASANKASASSSQVDASSASSSLNNHLAVHKQAFHSIAKCIAALTVTNQQEGQAVIKQFIADVKDSRSADSVRLLALLSLGETGKYM